MFWKRKEPVAKLNVLVPGENDKLVFCMPEATESEILMFIDKWTLAEKYNKPIFVNTDVKIYLIKHGGKNGTKRTKKD